MTRQAVERTRPDELKTILVVDDEPIVREVVVRYLQRDGYATLEAGDGDDARASCSSSERPTSSCST